MARVEGTVEIGSWDEQPDAEFDDGRKFTTAKVTQQFRGGISGAGAATWLTAYRPDGTADYVGYLRIDGAVEDVTGSVVLRLNGGYDGRVARTAFDVVEGAGTGGFERMQGSGVWEADSDGAQHYVLDYELG
jgi:uncharacterized protein DUF3224